MKPKNRTPRFWSCDLVGRLRKAVAVLLVAALAVLACGGAVTPGASGDPSALPSESGPLVVGPVAFAPPEIDPSADLRPGLASLESAERERLRTQAGFPTEVGAGWVALSGAADAALDAGIRLLAPEFGVDPPVGFRDGRLASTARLQRAVSPAPSSSVAAAMALVMAALTAGEALGSGGTMEVPAISVTETKTDGDEVATQTIKMKGKVVSTGSRVVADFTFELTGEVVNKVTGATARMRGTATAHVEIDGCPDANGSSKGRMSLSSNEDVFGPKGGGSGAGWTRELTGEFDIAVDDNASISGLVLDADAKESVKGGTREHELGVKGHWEYSSGEGFTGLTNREGTSTGEVTHEKDATADDLAPLFKSAAYAVSAAAVILGSKAEKFWRNGKCVEVIVDPEGGDVDPDSITDVIAKVRHKFEGNELDKPVEATLVGVKAIDPAGEKQPAPATVGFTAGSKNGDVGEVTFKTVSNRGIGEKTVKFTVRSGWIIGRESSPVFGKKCDGLGGKWVINQKSTGVGDASGVWVVTIDEKTLRGTYTVDLFATSGDSSVRQQVTGGTASLIVEADGSVTMTLTGGQVVITVTTPDETRIVTPPPADYQFLWVPAGDACNGE